MKDLLSLGCLILLGGSLFAQRATTETIKKELTFKTINAGSTLMIGNMNGSIQVEGYEGDKVIMEIEKTVKADTDSDYQRGLTEVKPKIETFGDTIMVEFDPPCLKMTRSQMRIKMWRGNQYGYYWEDCYWNPDYEFGLEYRVRVPRQIHVNVSTINGDISIKNVNGNLSVDNIHGSIQLDNVVGKVEASTIHGGLDLSYRENPVRDSEFYAHHGDINIKAKSGLAAKMYFQSHHGDFFTDIDDIQLVPDFVSTAVNDQDAGEGIIYKIGSKSVVQARNGNIKLNFRTHHGNVYVNEK